MEYNIVLKTYEGPMDLLLDLIKENEIDIYDIPIFKITEEFLKYIENMKKLNSHFRFYFNGFNSFRDKVQDAFT